MKMTATGRAWRRAAVVALNISPTSFLFHFTSLILACSAFHVWKKTFILVSLLQENGRNSMAQTEIEAGEETERDQWGKKKGFEGFGEWRDW